MKTSSQTYFSMLLDLLSNPSVKASALLVLLCSYLHLFVAFSGAWIVSILFFLPFFLDEQQTPVYFFIFPGDIQVPEFSSCGHVRFSIISSFFSNVAIQGLPGPGFLSTVSYFLKRFKSLWTEIILFNKVILEKSFFRKINHGWFTDSTPYLFVLTLS